MKQDAVNAKITALKDDLAVRIAKAEINAGKVYNPARHKEIMAETDWVLSAEKLTPRRKPKRRGGLQREIRRREDIAANAADRISSQRYDIDNLTPEHRRLAMSFSEENIGCRSSEPTILDQRLAERHGGAH